MRQSPLFFCALMILIDIFYMIQELEVLVQSFQPFCFHRVYDSMYHVEVKPKSDFLKKGQVMVRMRL